jgi:hypothetical protein
MADGDAGEMPQVSFGGFSVEGMDDPLAPRRDIDDVETVDGDAPPIRDLPGDPSMRGYPLGRTVLAGTSSLRGGAAVAFRVAVAVVLLVIAVGAALVLLRALL